MSLHKSLKTRNKHARGRNVLRREERLERLQQDERWSAGQSVFGLPKVRIKLVAPRKKEKLQEPAASETAAEVPDEGAEG